MNIDFESYIRQGEPDMKQKASAWKTAIGLQAVDGLQTSDYLKDVACKHIEGDISIDEVRDLVSTYYQSKSLHAIDDDTEEADKVSANIASILNEQSFAFSVSGFISIHRRLFEGVFKFAGNLRDFDITKKEWALRGDTVLYVNSEDLRRSLEYDLEQEKAFSYENLSIDEVVNHIVKFVSGIWQIHPFREGNTRTTAVFTIKYLRSIGFDVNNDLFADYSWYFRNALVRANYRNVRKGIEPNRNYLTNFFRNLMIGENNELKNRYLIVDAPQERFEEESKTITRQAPDKYPTCSSSVLILIKVIANKQLSIREILHDMNLKNRENLMVNYLFPAIKDGFVVMLYPDCPKHPRQKYLLTTKGRTVLD